MSQVRQNYHAESEEGVNKQINLELYAMYTYMSLSYYFNRDDVALPNFAEYFRKASHEEMEHAQIFMKFQNDRGGRVVLQDIKKPAKDEWGSGQEAMQAALELEKTVNQALLDLHKIADNHGDFHVSIYWANYVALLVYSLLLATDGGFHRGQVPPRAGVGHQGTG
jgi:ferritin heavy chain